MFSNSQGETYSHNSYQIVLRIDASQASIAEAIRKELATASRAFLDENEFIDIFVDEGGGVAVDVIKAVRPFYVRKPAR